MVKELQELLAELRRAQSEDTPEKFLARFKRISIPWRLPPDETEAETTVKVPEINLASLNQQIAQAMAIANKALKAAYREKPAPPIIMPESEVRFGAVQTEQTGSSTTITVQECNRTGETYSDAVDLTVYWNSDQSAFDPSLMSVAGTDDTTVSCTVASGTVIQFVECEDNNLYSFKTPMQTFYDWKVDEANAKLQARYAWDFGPSDSGPSDWVDLYTGTTCEDTPEGLTTSWMGM